MTSESAQAGDVAMKGAGYYSTATKGAREVIDQATPLVLRAIDAMPDSAFDSSARPFTISDMGCADGGTSLGMIGQAIDRVRCRAADRLLMVVYADQPRNDYNALFQIIHGLTNFESYLQRFEGVFPLASATSFYRAIVPPGSLDLGFSATAMHWLSRKPCNITDHVHMVGASGETLRAFAAQAQADWESLLLHRAVELNSGGRLVLVNFARDEAGRYLGNTGGVNMFDTFSALWQQQVEAGDISAAEFAEMTLPQYYHTVEEFIAPLNNPNGRVNRAGLRLDHVETRVVECPFAAEFRQHQNAARFAREYIPTLRSWSESTFFAGLDRSRPIEQRQEIIDAFYASYQAAVTADPTGHGMDYVHAYLTISKS